MEDVGESHSFSRDQSQESQLHQQSQRRSIRNSQRSRVRSSQSNPSHRRDAVVLNVNSKPVAIPRGHEIESSVLVKNPLKHRRVINIASEYGMILGDLAYANLTTWDNKKTVHVSEKSIVIALMRMAWCQGSLPIASRAKAQHKFDLEVFFQSKVWDRASSRRFRVGERFVGPALADIASDPHWFTFQRHVSQDVEGIENVVRKINKELAEKKSESLSETKHEPEDYRNDIQDKTQESEEKMDDSGEEAAEDKANNPNAKKSKFSKFSLRRKKPGFDKSKLQPHNKRSDDAYPFQVNWDLNNYQSKTSLFFQVCEHLMNGTLNPRRLHRESDSNASELSDDDDVMWGGQAVKIDTTKPLRPMSQFSTSSCTPEYQTMVVRDYNQSGKLPKIFI
mmetsp:Transcript_10203/g.13385  ORF Transcript_10203/g.13385 Transcript_10203/m.13385 type:complete len:393 (+) Transcript_10203:31-1209(+)